MPIFTKILSLKLSNSHHFNNHQHSIVTIGTFDGVHIGHQKIIKRLIKVGNEKGLKTIVLTFFPHPRMVLQKDSNIKLLNTIEEREAVMSSLGLDHMVVEKFTKEFSNLSARDFVKTILVDALNAKHIIIGYDHQFGKDRSADINDLRSFGIEFGFDVEEISAQDVEDVSVSSTKIRRALLDGDVATANAYLGYPYFLTGVVVRGKGLGKTIGFPTANIHIKDDYKLIPKDGVYAVKAYLNTATILGMMNIGSNPTVNGTSQSIEVNLFDFETDIYDSIIKVELIDFIRDEHKFDSLDALKLQLNQDKLTAINILKYHG